MWRVAFSVMLWNQRTQALLSLYTLVGPEMLLGTGTPQALKSRVKSLAAMVSLLPILVVLVSASHELSDVHCCHSVFQEMGPLMQRIMAPLMLRNLNSGTGVPLRTAFPS